MADDQNCDSAIEDSDHERDLWEPAERPEPGDIIVWGSIWLAGKRVRIGHVALIESVSRVLEWDPHYPDFSLLDVIQVCGGNGRKPAALRSNGAIWNRRDHILGGVHPAYRSRLLRSVP